MVFVIIIIDTEERDRIGSNGSDLEFRSVFPRGFDRGLLLTWEFNHEYFMKIVFSVCKKSTNSSAANHQLNLMLMAIWDREHYLLTYTALAIS